MSAEELLKYLGDLMKELSTTHRAALAAALFSASTNNSIEQWAGALAAMSDAVTGNNPNMVADMHYCANKQGYGLALDSALKGVLDKVRGGP